jgi:hypothetical protein
MSPGYCNASDPGMSFHQQRTPLQAEAKMSSAHEHHAKAEKLLELSRIEGDGILRSLILAEAQVHATVALAAATENPRPRRAAPRPGRASLVPQENKLVKPPLPGVGNRLYRPDRTSPSPRRSRTTSAEPQD